MDEDGGEVEDASKMLGLDGMDWIEVDWCKNSKLALVQVHFTRLG